MICILVFAYVLFRQGGTNQGTSKEKKTGMIFDGQLGEISRVYRKCTTWKGLILAPLCSYNF